MHEGWIRETAERDTKMTIQAQPVATLRRACAEGKSGGSPAEDHRTMTVALTTEPGTVAIPSGTGSRAAAYGANEVVISDHDTTVAGPLSRADAVALATAVLEGHRRAVTHPQLHLLLAGAVLAFTAGANEAPPGSPPPEPSRPDTERTDDDRI